MATNPTAYTVGAALLVGMASGSGGLYALGLTTTTEAEAAAALAACDVRVELLTEARDKCEPALAACASHLRGE